MCKENDNSVNEPLEAYGQPLTFNKVWLLFKETDRKMQETTMKMQETDRRMKELQAMYGGVSNTNGEIAEAFFYDALKTDMQIGEMQFEVIQKNTRRKRQGFEQEYDIILFNDKVVAVVEVKYKLHPDDVKRFVEIQLPGFRKLFPEFDAMQLFAGIGSFVIPDDSLKLAENHGLFVLQPGGKEVALSNTEGFSPKSY
ncbi:MAG: hypothetical protein KKA07_12750 [Bacteroidetes bacterium]|nr:hypothetical protein [Bacteroidota bacterium]MBU1719927.1 hypothetical protein [Bacteroidota bacterium]